MLHELPELAFAVGARSSDVGGAAGRHNTALAEAQAAVQLSPDAVAAQTTLGDAPATLKRLTEARAAH